MAYGAQVYDSAGTLIVSNLDFLTKVSGNLSISAGGSLVVPGLLAGNKVFVTFVPTGSSQNSPDVTISGTTINWTYAAGTPQPGILVYGMF